MGDRWADVKLVRSLANSIRAKATVNQSRRGVNGRKRSVSSVMLQTGLVARDFNEPSGKVGRVRNLPYVSF